MIFKGLQLRFAGKIPSSYRCLLKRGMPQGSEAVPRQYASSSPIGATRFVLYFDTASAFWGKAMSLMQYIVLAQGETMFSHETGGEYAYEDWIKDVWNDQSKAGFSAWLLLLMTLGVAIAAILFFWGLLPPGSYPRIVISAPALLVSWIFYHLAGRVIYALFVAGSPKPE
jgi:hypothetical protein